MKKVMGIIRIDKNDDNIRELAEKRSIGAVPIAGRYRMIDFALSSMVNSGIINVGVMLPDEPRSVLDHLRSGKDWDLARHHNGLYYLPSAPVDVQSAEGDLKDYYHNLDYVENSSKASYVILANSSFVYNIDLAKVYQFHKDHNADITMVYAAAKEEKVGPNVVLETEDNGLVKDIAARPAVYNGSKCSLEIYVMNKQIFLDMVRESYEHGGKDLLMDGIVRQASKYAIYAVEHEGYASHVTSTANFYNTNMDMLKPEVWSELFMTKNASIYTKLKDGTPVQYKEGARVKNSLLASSCVIEGEVENSIIFRGVTIGKGARIKNSIIMQGCTIKAGALVEDCICDKNVVISEGRWLKGAPNYPVIVNKDVLI